MRGHLRPHWRSGGDGGGGSLGASKAVQLDPEAVVVEFVSAFFGMLGALLVALVVYRWTRDDQRAIFEEEAQRAARVREEEERAQRSAIRAALHYEIADNLERLEAFWSRIVLPDDEKSTAEAVARRLVGTAVPIWNTGIQQGAAAIVAVAITREQLSETFRLYNTLAEIAETQRRLQVARDSDTAAYAAEPETPPLMHGMSPHKIQTTDYFGGAARTLIPDLVSRVESALARGRPVSTDPVPYEPQE